MMGDMGDYWKDVGPGLKQDSKERRSANRENSARLLTNNKISFESKNSGSHLIVEGIIDFWPGTGKFRDRRNGFENRGVFNLFKQIKRGNVHDKRKEMNSEKT